MLVVRERDVEGKFVTIVNAVVLANGSLSIASAAQALELFESRTLRDIVQCEGGKLND